MKVRLALLQTVLARQAGLVIMAAAFVVLARLLTPEAYGAFAAAIAVFKAAEIVVGFGLTSWLVVEKELDEDAAAAGLGLSLTLAAITALGAVLIVLALGSRLGADVLPMTLLLAGALLVFPVELVFSTLLARQLHFGTLSLLAVGRAAIDASVGIALAALGFGPVALTAGVLAERLLASAVLGLLAARRGEARASVRGWGRFATLGRRLVFINLLPKVADLVVALSVTTLLGTGAMGLLNRARTIESMLDRSLLEGIKPVILPAMSRSMEAGHPPSAVYLFKTTQLLVVCWPVFLVIAVLAEPLVSVMLGDQWDAAVLPVRLLALGGLATPFTRMSGKFYVSLGQTGEYAVIQAVHNALMVGAVLLATTVSTGAVCAAISGALIVKAAILTVRIKVLTGYETREWLRAVAQSGTVAGACALGPAALVVFADGASAGVILVGGIGAAAAAWFGVTALVGHPIADEIATYARTIRGQAGRRALRRQGEP